MNGEIGRRELITGAAALAVGVAAKAAAAAPQRGHEHHKKSESAEIVDAAHACVSTGEACMDHCLTEFRKGNAELGNCATAVQEMLATCRGLSTLASHGSDHLARYAYACIDICRSCEDECSKHADEHPPCRDCADACAKCIDECQKHTAQMPASIGCP